MFVNLGLIEDIEIFFNDSLSFLHRERVKELLRELIPDRNRREFFDAKLPFIKRSLTPSTLSVILLTKKREEASSFFYDMVRRWLIPQRLLSLNLFFSIDFSLHGIEERFTLMEVSIPLASEQEFEEVKKNIAEVEAEIKLGVVSDYHAKRILESKGISNDRKTALIQEKIGSLIQNRPLDFGKSIFNQMQHFLVTCRDDFKSVRDYHHISRIISNLHQIRKLLKQKVSLFPGKRHLFLKFMKTKLHVVQREKTVLGVLVGMNFLKEHEIFEKEHLIVAIQSFIPEVRMVENSFFEDSQNKEIQAVYLEIEKENEKDFSYDEIQHLRVALPSYLKDHVEQLVHPVFMPRNEEEIVKNIMTLSGELKYVHDIPQVIISFDQQTMNELSFVIVFLRILKPRDPLLKDIFDNFRTKIKFVQDRVKKVGVIRKKYFKEANVFRAILPSHVYLRTDHSIDLSRARQNILSELFRLFGEVRDYNGGMICKQAESYQKLKKLLGNMGQVYESLLEKFFYSLHPVEMSAVVDVEVLKNLFLCFFSAIKGEKEGVSLFVKEEKRVVYVIAPPSSSQKYIVDELEKLQLFFSEFVTFSIDYEELLYVGYCFFCENEEQKNNLSTNVHQLLEKLK